MYIYIGSTSKNTCIIEKPKSKLFKLLWNIKSTIYYRDTVVCFVFA